MWKATMHLHIVLTVAYLRSSANLLSKHPFQSLVQVIYKDLEENRAKDGTLWNPTSDRLPAW